MKKGVLLIVLLFELFQTNYGQKPELIVSSGHSDTVNSITFSPDGKTLASVSSDETVKLWDVNNGLNIRTIGDDESVYSAVFSPDGKTLAVGAGNEGTEIKIKLFAVESGELLKTFEGHTKQINMLAFSPDGKIIASGSEDKTAKLWDIRSGEEIRQFIDHKYEINTLRFTPDGKGVIVGDMSSNKLWDVIGGVELEKIKKTYGDNSNAFSLNAKIYAYSEGETWTIYDLETQKVVREFKGSNRASWKAAFSIDGKIFAGVDEKHNITLWSMTDGTKLGTMKGGQEQGIFNAISSDSKLLAQSGSDNSIKLWDVSSQEVLKKLVGHTDEVTSLAFNSDKSILASGSDDKTIRLWDLQTKNLLKTLTGSKDSINKLTFSKDGKLLASATDNFIFNSDDKNIRVWNVQSGEEIWKFETNFNHPVFAFNFDGKMFAIGGEDGTVIIKSLTDGKILKSFIGHEGKVLFLEFNPNGKILDTTGEDGKNKSWNTNSWTLSATSSTDQLTSWTVKQGLDFIVKLNFMQASQKFYIMAMPYEGAIKLISKSSEQVNQIFDMKSDDENTLLKLESARIYLLNNDEWIVTTPEGLFDGMPAAWKQLIWRFSNNTFNYAPVETYFNDFFYPNLLQDVIDGKRLKPKAGQELEKIDRRQPKVEIAAINGKTKNEINALAANQFITDKRTATVTIEVAENADKKKQPDHQETSGAQDLRLFRNGALVKVWRGDVFGKENDCEKILTKAGEPRRARCAVEVPVVVGANDLSAYAFNSQNVKSNDDAVSVKGADVLKRDGTLYVLAIGVNEYADKKYNLNFAVPDVVDIGKAVGAEQNKLRADAKLKQYATTEIITLKDETATKENILLALKRFAKDGEKANLPENFCANLAESSCSELKTELAKIKPAEPEDALLIYYAGHGTSREQRFFLLPHNFTDAKKLEKQSVSDLELNEYLERVDAGKLLMVIDACQSGQALGAKDEGRAPMNSKGLAQLAYDKGMLILTAAQSRQAALEAPRIGSRKVEHGLLTYALLEAMNDSQTNADKDANKQLWEREWFDYAVEQVPQLQLEAMKQRRIDLRNGAAEVKGRSDIIYLDGDDPNLDPEKRRVQTPRVFYRREPEINPLVLAKP